MPDYGTAAAMVSHDTDSFTISFEAAENTQVYSADNAASLSVANIDSKYAVTKGGDGKYTIPMTMPLTDGYNQKTKAFAVSTTTSDGLELRRVYTLYFYKIGTTKGVLAGMPDAITDYMCVASQYTSGGNVSYGMYGLYPEKTMNSTGSWNSCISVGNFGGCITYYYENPITDDPRNPYGIDFTVFGNANPGPTFTEPGEVLVSEDGETWYTLAGSEHYEKIALWNYSVTYKKTTPGGICDYTDSLGNEGSLGASFRPLTYPEPRLYPMHNLDGKTVTVTGTRLYSAENKVGEGIEQSGVTAQPKWGYADIHSNGTSTAGDGEDVNLLLTKVGNPYAASYNGYGDGFDLKWAVDANGLPVNTDNLKIHYVKVQTCSFINGGIFGEKSTEVSCVVRTRPESEPVGQTDAVATITVGGKSLMLTPDKTTYYTPMNGETTVQVDTAPDVNVYIGNARATERTYTETPDKGIVRVVLQKGDQTPVIYYIVNGSESAHTHTRSTENDHVDSTCIEPGFDAVITYCAECGEVTNRTETPLPLADHTAGEPVVETEPTCKQEGVSVTTCEVCGAECSRETMSKTGHVIEKGRCKTCGKSTFVLWMQKLIDTIKNAFRGFGDWFLRLFKKQKSI